MYFHNNCVKHFTQNKYTWTLNCFTLYVLYEKSSRPTVRKRKSIALTVTCTGLHVQHVWIYSTCTVHEVAIMWPKCLKNRGISSKSPSSVLSNLLILSLSYFLLYYLFGSVIFYCFTICVRNGLGCYNTESISRNKKY